MRNLTLLILAFSISGCMAGRTLNLLSPIISEQLKKPYKTEYEEPDSWANSPPPDSSVSISKLSKSKVDTTPMKGLDEIFIDLSDEVICDNFDNKDSRYSAEAKRRKLDCLKF
jgi:hypothetical protein